jgi:hypothetical protein
VGIVLIALGGVLLAANLGYELPYRWWRFYPFVFIVLGVLGILMPSRHLDRSTGVWLLATGLYCAMGVYYWFGLGWAGAWPVFVIAAGASFLLHRRPDEASPPQEGPR